MNSLMDGYGMGIVGGGCDWRPSASLDLLRQRAGLLHRIRTFFWERGVVEVETPLLLAKVAPELHQDPVSCGERFLLTSPETSMKRLLAVGMGAIYQIGHAFRDGECGPLHNPEFTILEWYRPGWSYRELMTEVEALLIEVLRPCRSVVGTAQVLTFATAFQQFAGIDPFVASNAELTAACGCQLVHKVSADDMPDDQNLDRLLERAEMLDRLLIQRVEPGLKALGGAVFLVDFPAAAAAMAQVDPGPPAMARRFELYLDGVEVANGYQELVDATEQRQRLLAVNRQRCHFGKSPLPIDELFLHALECGLPACSGVAVGLDRLIMLAVGAKNIQEVMAFPFDRV